MDSSLSKQDNCSFYQLLTISLFYNVDYCQLSLFFILYHFFNHHFFPSFCSQFNSTLIITSLIGSKKNELSVMLFDTVMILRIGNVFSVVSSFLKIFQSYGLFDDKSLSYIHFCNMTTSIIVNQVVGMRIKLDILISRYYEMLLLKYI